MIESWIPGIIMIASDTMRHKSPVNVLGLSPFETGQSHPSQTYTRQPSTFDNGFHEICCRNMLSG